MGYSWLTIKTSWMLVFLGLLASQWWGPCSMVPRGNSDALQETLHMVQHPKFIWWGWYCCFCRTPRLWFQMFPDTFPLVSLSIWCSNYCNQKQVWNGQRRQFWLDLREQKNKECNCSLSLVYWFSTLVHLQAATVENRISRSRNTSLKNTVFILCWNIT